MTRPEATSLDELRLLVVVDNTTDTLSSVAETRPSVTRIRGWPAAGPGQAATKPSAANPATAAPRRQVPTMRAILAEPVRRCPVCPTRRGNPAAWWTDGAASRLGSGREAMDHRGRPGDPAEDRRDEETPHG